MTCTCLAHAQLLMTIQPPKSWYQEHLWTLLNHPVHLTLLHWGIFILFTFWARMAWIARRENNEHRERRR